jgi:hypothetical protein
LEHPLADPDNSVCDGPTAGLVDRDAPVQSTGRDIDHFAFTWDDNNVYLYTQRVGSTNNVQRFVYYADTSNDGLLQTGERVIGVNWTETPASSRSTSSSTPHSPRAETRCRTLAATATDTRCQGAS